MADNNVERLDLRCSEDEDEDELCWAIEDIYHFFYCFVFLFRFLIVVLNAVIVF